MSDTSPDSIDSVDDMADTARINDIIIKTREALEAVKLMVFEDIRNRNKKRLKIHETEIAKLIELIKNGTSDK